MAVRLNFGQTSQTSKTSETSQMLTDFQTSTTPKPYTGVPGKSNIDRFAVNIKNELNTTIFEQVNNYNLNTLMNKNQLFDFSLMRSFTQQPQAGDDSVTTGFSFIADTSFTDGSKFFEHLRDLYYKDSLYISYPKVIYHSTDTVSLVLDDKYNTNDFNLDQNDVYNIKEKYLNEKIKNVTSKFFLESNNSALNRKNYYDDMLNFGKEVETLTGTHFNNFLNNRNKIIKEFNFGNHIHEYFLKDKSSKKIGRMAEFLLKDELVNSRPNNLFITNASSNLFSYEARLGRGVINQDSLEKCYSLIFSTKNSENESHDRIENTDSMIGQLFTNNSLLFDHLYKDSWNTGIALEKLENANEINVLNSNYIQQTFTITKNISLLSLGDEDDKLAFNPYRKKIINSNDALNSEINYFPSITDSLIQSEDKVKQLLEKFKFFCYTIFPFRSDHIILNMNENFGTWGFGKNIINRLLFNEIKEIDLFNTSLYTPYMFRHTRLKKINYELETTTNGSGDISSLTEEINDELGFFFDIFPYENWSLTSPDQFLYCPKFMYLFNRNNFTNDNGEEFNINIKSLSSSEQGDIYFFPKVLRFCKKSTRDATIYNQTGPKFEFNLPLFSRRRGSDQGSNLKSVLSWPTKYIMQDNSYLSITENATIEFDKILDDNSDDLYLPLKNLYNSNIKNYASFNKNLNLLSNQNNVSFEVISDNSQDRSYLGTGYILLKNSQKVHSLEDMKSKFIDKSASLSDESEYFTNRLVSYSNSCVEDQDENIKNIANPLKENCFESKISSDDWTLFTTKLHKSLQNLKRFKIKKSGSNNSKKIVSFYDSFLEKIIKTNSDFSLLYGDESDLAIDNFNKSMFLQEINGRFYSKNNAQTFQPGIQNKIDLSIESQVEDLDINSNEYKDFLSEYYPSGIAKNSKNLFKRILKHILFDLENAGSNNISFFKLLSNAIKENKSVIKVLLYSYLNKQITNNSLNIESAEDGKLVNNNMANSIVEYINTVYNFKNIQKQKSYTLRTVDFPDTTLPLTADNHYVALGMMPGNIYKFLFPFYEYKYCLKDVENAKLSSAIQVNNFTENVFGSNRSRLFLELFNSFTYNYDCYLSETTSFNNGKFNIDYIVKDNNIQKMIPIEITNDNNVSIQNLFANDNDLIDTNTFISKIIKKNEDSLSLNELFSDDILPPSLNYKKIIYNISDKVISTYYNSFYFKIIKEILEYLDISEFRTATNKEDIGNYINQNEDLVDIFKDILEIVAEMYNSIYSLYEDFSISNQISDIMKIENENNNKVINPSDLLINKGNNYAKGVGLNEEILQIIIESINSILSNDSLTCELDQFSNISINDRSTLYTRLHENIEKSINALNNSKILEAISHDVVFSYLLDFEEKSVKVDEFNNSVNKVSSFISDGFSNNTGLDLNVVDILNNMPKMCKIYRKITEKYVYYNEFRGFLQNNNTTIPTDDYKNIFKDFIEKDFAFKSYLDKEESIQKLISYGKKRLYLKDSSQSIFDITDNIDNTIDDFRYDVLDNRFEIVKLGISHDIAKILSSQKILQIKVNIFNHKYPELQFNPIEIYYTPMLTSLPTYAPLMIDANEDLNRHLGFYNFNADEVKNLFIVVDIDEAFEAVRSVFENSKGLGRNLSNDDIIIMTNILVNSHVMSNAIKYANYNNQKFLSEDNINDIDDILGNYIGNNMSKHYFNMSSQEFENIFGFEIDTFNQSVLVDNESIRRINKFETIKNKNHAYEFFDIFNQYVSTECIYENFIDNKYFDIFSFKITHTDILKRLNRDIDNFTYSRIVNSYLQDTSSKNSYSYIIEADIL